MKQWILPRRTWRAVLPLFLFSPEGSLKKVVYSRKSIGLCKSMRLPY